MDRATARVSNRRARAAACALGATLAIAGIPAAGQSLRVTPGASLSETYSTNPSLVVDSLARNGWISDLAGTLHVENALEARAHVYVDYRVHRLWYSDNTGRDDTQQFLDAIGRVEAVEKSLYLDGRASIGLENRSAFGTVLAPSTPGTAAGRVETRVYRLSPLWRGNLGEFALFRTQYAFTEQRVDDRLTPDLATHHWFGQVRNVSGGTRAGWSLEGDYVDMRPQGAVARDIGLVRATLLFLPVPTFQALVSAGYESTNLVAEGREKQSMPGLGFTWTPSDRTTLGTLYERRFFGTGYANRFRHRTARTVWEVNAVREVTNNADRIAAGGGTSMSQMLDSLLATAIPDPQQRSNAVAQRFDRSGLSDASTLNANFVSTVPQLERRVDASVAYLGTRDTFMVRGLRRDIRALAGSGVADVVALENNVRRTGYSGDITHNVTPLTALHATAARVKTDSLDLAGPTSLEKIFTLYVTTQLGPRVFGTLGARRTSLESNVVGSYRENAVFATFAVRL